VLGQWRWWGYLLALRSLALSTLADVVAPDDVAQAAELGSQARGAAEVAAWEVLGAGADLLCRAKYCNGSAEAQPRIGNAVAA
jgi:hypothetical protein